MGSNDALMSAVLVLLSGGFATAVYNLTKARVESKRAPAERNTIVAEGAEKAVVSLGKALDEAERRITQLRDDLKGYKEELKKKDMIINNLQAKLDDVEDVVLNLRQHCEHLDDALAIIRREES